MWIREVLPTGWGDTYFQGPGQSCDITTLPKGPSWIEVYANPAGAFLDADPSNDVELREVIFCGRRTVSVSPWHGIDTEMWYGVRP